MSKATDTNLREVHENADAINEWLRYINSHGVGLNQCRMLCTALANCVSWLESYAHPKRVCRTKAVDMWDVLEDRKSDAANKIAYIRELLEK